MSDLLSIIMLSVVVEALIEYGKLIFNKEINWKQIAAIVIAVALAILAQKDAFAFLGLSFSVPYVGMILTGIFLSRGANYFADFIKRLQVKQG